MDPAVPRSPVPASFRSLWESGRQSGSHLVHLIVHADASNVDQNEIREAWKARKVTCPKHLPSLTPPARQSHQHPQATSRMPDTHCARSTPSAHPSQRRQISAPVSDTLCPTLPGPHSSCVSCVYSALKLIPPATCKTIYGSPAFACHATFCALWSSRGVPVCDCRRCCALALVGPGRLMRLSGHLYEHGCTRGSHISVLFNGGMLYGGMEGQGRKKCCVRRVFAPVPRSEHA